MLVSSIMRKIKSSETKPEVILRKKLWRKGVRYRKNVAKLIGKPDIVIHKYKLAIFVDGDFWHGKQFKLRGYSSLEEQFKGVASREYWIKKIKRNMQRDKVVNRELEKQDWKVIRFYESDVIENPDKCVSIILALVTSIDKRGPRRGGKNEK